MLKFTCGMRNNNSKQYCKLENFMLQSVAKINKSNCANLVVLILNNVNYKLYMHINHNKRILGALSLKRATTLCATIKVTDEVTRW